MLNNLCRKRQSADDHLSRHTATVGVTHFNPNQVIIFNSEPLRLRECEQLGSGFLCLTWCHSTVLTVCCSLFIKRCQTKRSLQVRICFSLELAVFGLNQSKEMHTHVGPK